VPAAFTTQLLHDNSEASVEAIKNIILSYRSSFGNPQVMMTTAPVTPEFYGN